MQVTNVRSILLTLCSTLNVIDCVWNRMCWQFLGWSMFLSHIPQVWGRHPWFTSSVIRRCSAAHLGPWGAQWKSRQASLHARIHTLLWRVWSPSLLNRRENSSVKVVGTPPHFASVFPLQLHEYGKTLSSPSSTYFLEFWDVGGSPSHSKGRAVFYQQANGRCMCTVRTPTRPYVHCRQRNTVHRCPLLPEGYACLCVDFII